MFSASNALTSLIMSLPLVAVPCLAIFGLSSSDSQPATTRESGVQLAEFGSNAGLAEAFPDFDKGDEDLDKGDEDLAAGAPAQEYSSVEDRDQAEGASSEQHPGAERGAAGSVSRTVRANTISDKLQRAATSATSDALANTSFGLEGSPRQPSERASQQEAATDRSPVFTSAATAPDHTELDHSQENPFASESPTREDVATEPPAETDERSANVPAWKAAITRLRELGIQRFHLTNGNVPGRFFFSCSLQTSPNVRQRFEAEADSPVAAARDVVSQAESWARTR